jgi:type IV pilus assembly protein PilA
MNRDNRGFSLLELLIVVAIILIIATIAIPSLLRSRQAANESAAVANIRTINTAEITYISSSGGFYTDLATLASAGPSGGLLDSRFTANPVQGYNYTLTLSSAKDDYTIFAAPAGNNGRWGYYSTPDAVIRYSTQSALAPTNQAGMPVQ